MAKQNTYVTRNFRLWPWLVGGLALGVGFLSIFAAPVVAFVSHALDRVRNGSDKDYELNVRAKTLRVQIGNQLGIAPERVSVNEFRMAAEVNPMLRNAYDEVVRKEKRENRNSLMMNGATAFVPGGRLAVEAGTMLKTAKAVGASFASLGVSSLFNREIISSQEALEAIGNDRLKAQNEGRDVRSAVTPQAIFMLRVAQDEVLGKEIKKAHGKNFHQLPAQEQLVVMSQYPQLTNAVTSEAHAVANNIMPLEDLMARAPNLAASASRYAQGPAAGFVNAVNNARANAAQTQNAGGVA